MAAGQGMKSVPAFVKKSAHIIINRRAEIKVPHLDAKVRANELIAGCGWADVLDVDPHDFAGSKLCPPGGQPGEKQEERAKANQQSHRAGSVGHVFGAHFGGAFKPCI